MSNSRPVTVALVSTNLPPQASAMDAECSAENEPAASATVRPVPITMISTKRASQLLEIEEQKKCVTSHPLYPLLVMLFEQCEKATQTGDCASADEFNKELREFVKHNPLELRQNCSKTFNTEMDVLMREAVQVLRIHLLELEKVNELREDFCQKYTKCLKNTLQKEKMLGSAAAAAAGGISSGDEDFCSDDALSPTPGDSSTTLLSPSSSREQITSVEKGFVEMVQVQTADGVMVAQPLLTNAVHGGTPLSKISSTPLSPLGNSNESALSASSSMVGLSPGEDMDEASSSKRGVLPKRATSIMRSWLFQHIMHPYPTEDEKKVLSDQTGLTMLQVNNWFINARRRILQPMLDASNMVESPKVPKRTKTLSSQSSAERFWPTDLALNARAKDVAIAAEKSAAAAVEQERMMEARARARQGRMDSREKVKSVVRKPLGSSQHTDTDSDSEDSRKEAESFQLSRWGFPQK